MQGVRQAFFKLILHLNRGDSPRHELPLKRATGASRSYLCIESTCVPVALFTSLNLTA